MSVRRFDTGATRDLDDSKPDYEGYLSPSVIIRFGEYMTKHRQTAAGPRASDNWQKGIPRDAYIKSLFRHFVDLWRLHRAPVADAAALEEALCAILFNASGYLHEYLKARGEAPRTFDTAVTAQLAKPAQVGELEAQPYPPDDVMGRTHSG